MRGCACDPFHARGQAARGGPRQCGKSPWPTARLSRSWGFAASLFRRRHELAQGDGDVRTSIDRRGCRACRRGALLRSAPCARERWGRKLRDRRQERAMTVHFIGAGPGAPDLITLRGRDLIARSPVCLFAGSLVPRALLEHCPKGARIVDTAPMSLDEISGEFLPPCRR